MVDRVPRARRTVPPAAAAAAEERGGSRLAQGNYFGGRIAGATPASHLTQGRSNEDIPVKQCWLFQQQKAARSSHINWDMPSPTRANVDAKKFERNPCQIRLGHLHPANQKFFRNPCSSSSFWGSERRDMNLNFPQRPGSSPQVLQ